MSHALDKLRTRMDDIHWPLVHQRARFVGLWIAFAAVWYIQYFHVVPTVLSIVVGFGLVLLAPVLLIGFFVALLGARTASRTVRSNKGLIAGAGGAYLLNRQAERRHREILEAMSPRPELEPVTEPKSELEPVTSSPDTTTAVDRRGLVDGARSLTLKLVLPWGLPYVRSHPWPSGSGTAPST